MTPEPNPDQLPLTSAPPEVEQPEDLTEYNRFITHDKYRNTIAVHDTLLIQHFCKSAPYMEDLHRKQLVDLDMRMVKHRNNNISRTAHQQVAAIIARYLPKIKEQNSPLADQLEPALAEAKKVESLCAQLTEEVQRNRTMGNVRFVKELVPNKKDMIFRNELPLTAPAEQWLEDGIPPDAWLWHIPAGQYLVETQARPVPDDLRIRFLQFVQWLMLESMWCQVYRLHQVSHREWQLVYDYCMELQRECLFLVPNEFTGVGFDICLGICKFDESYARYLPWMRELFSKYGFKKNPTNPLDDPRNPQYNLWADIREMRRPKEPIVKVSTGNCDQIIGLELED